MDRKLLIEGRALLALLALLAASFAAKTTACTLPGVGGTGGADAGAGGDAQTSTTSSTSTGSAACLLPESKPSDAGLLSFESFEATVLDTTGSPQKGVPIAVCGKGACTPEVQSGDDGMAAIMVAPLSLNRPAARWGDGILRALFGVRIEAISTKLTVRSVDLTDTGVPVEEGIDISFGKETEIKATLSIPLGTYPDFDPFLFDTPEKRTLRAALSVGAEAEMLAPGQGFSIIVSLGPAPIYLCNTEASKSGATLTIDNVSGLPQGTIDFYQFEFDAEERTGMFGEWVLVNSGTVSGSQITMDAGKGLRVIGTVGIKVPEPKP